MSTFTFNTYQLDEFGEYSLSDPSDPTSRIILSTQTGSVNYALARLGQASKSRPVLSFDIKKDSSDNWYLISNKQTLVGRFPELEYAIGALYGCFIYRDGDPNSFVTWIEDCLSKGNSVIDDAFNSLRLRREGNDLKASLSSIDQNGITPPLTGTGAYYLAIQTTPLDTSGTSTLADFVAVASLAASGNQELTESDGYLNLPEGDEAEACVIFVDPSDGTSWVKTNITSNEVKKPAPPPVIVFTVEIDQAVLLEISTAVISDNSTGVPNGVNYTYEWFRSTSVVTGLTLTKE